ncbi:uncharacterized protein LOC143885559 isoform X2 [Tasmannia lanceolata]|uniref:uncharacterized protein LOC143885522 isoform X2 n=1 Tax=Tasmannia lanceolata TaxID=3420 RepID=UPI004063333C
MQLFQLGGWAVSNVSKSVSVLDLSGKEKTTKAPRRLSIPAKSSVSPLPRPVSSIIRTKKSTSSQGNCDTPASDASKSTNRQKFSGSRPHESGNPMPNDETQQDDKENLGASQLEEISLTVK